MMHTLFNIMLGACWVIEQNTIGIRALIVHIDELRAVVSEERGKSDELMSYLACKSYVILLNDPEASTEGERLSPRIDCVSCVLARLGSSGAKFRLNVERCEPDSGVCPLETVFMSRFFHKYGVRISARRVDFGVQDYVSSRSSWQRRF